MPLLPAQRPGVNHLTGAPQEEKDLVDVVAANVLSFENGVGIDFKQRCEKFYRQYRGFKRFRHSWEAAGPNDRDGVLLDAKQTWGANLHIPLSFRTVEHMVPSAIAHRPRMLYLPAEQRFERNVTPVRLMIDRQQEQIDIDLEFQDVMRNGMIYGIGWGKTFWRTEWARSRKVTRRMWLPDRFKLGDPQQRKSFDDPDFESLDVFDVMWDPFGSSVRSCEWIVHRTWLSLSACLSRIETGAWNTASAAMLDEEKLRGMGNGQKYDEVWNERMTASGFRSARDAAAGEQVHEVWEWHDGERVLTVLDRRVLVQDAENPCFGTMPFQVYRPTKLQGQMVGIGELEPVEHLNRELDTLRSQRRDAATIALCAGYAFDSAAIEEEDLEFGPASAIRVTNGRPSDALFPLPVRDVPGSGYQEEQVIRGDFDAVTGISDALSGGDGAPIGTATEAQLVQASLSKRINLKSRRFEVEVVRHAARCFLKLDQRMILQPRAPIRQPGAGMTMEESAQAGRWQWYPIDPGAIQGEFEIIPEGGSMVAENVPQMRQDAVQIMQLFGQHPLINETRPVLKALQLFGEKDPEGWLKQPDPPVPQAVFDILSKMGVDGRLIQSAIRQAQAQSPQASLDQQGPNVDQMNQAMAA